MQNLLRKLSIPVLLSIIVCMSIFLCGCKRNNSEEETNDIGVTYFSGNSEDESIVYTIESAYWNKHWIVGQGESIPDWYLLIRIQIVNNTADNYTPNNNLFTVYYETPEKNVDVNCYLYEMLDMGNGGYSSRGISYVKPGQTAYLSMSGNHFNENPSIKYTDKFYLVHKIQTALGTETKTFNLGVLKED